MEERLQQLGDPSGQQTSDYWNEWFSVVGSERQFFEWYCNAQEVARLLHYHLPCDDDNNDNQVEAVTEQPRDDTLQQQQRLRLRRRRMIHPGAGNSLVPHKLRPMFPFHDHVVVDISPVALDMAKSSWKEEDLQNNNHGSSKMDFLVGNVLAPPLHPSLESNSFEAWIDKGLIDALFDKDHMQENQRDCATVFQEAYRLLIPNSGVVVTITLAEPHTLELMLQNWIGQDRASSTASPSSSISGGWGPTLHVWELVPISGKMRPFGFVMTKQEDDDTPCTNRKLVMHLLDGGALSTTVHSLEGMSASTVMSTVTAILDESRQRFLQAQQQHDERNLQHEQQSHAVNNSPYRLLATMDVKPYDDEVDLMNVGRQVTTRDYAKIGPIRWVPWNDDDADSSDHVIVPHRAGAAATTTAASFAKLVPMAFGLSKLVLRCLVPSSDELEAVIEDILEWHSENGGDCIQSIDIDWEETHPVGTVKPRP